MQIFKKLSSLLLLLLLTLTTLNLSYAQVSDTDDAEEMECITLSYSMRLSSRDSNTNNEVSKLQVFLSQANYLDSDPTGYYGNATRKAVRAFQQDNRLVVTGTIGVVTRAKIKSVSCASNNNPVTPVLNDPVVISPINGMLNVTYYKLNQTGDKCTSVLFIGNRGDNVVNGQFVYLSGQYKTQADCEAANKRSDGTPVIYSIKVVNANGGSEIIQGQSASIIVDSSTNMPRGYIDFTSVVTGIVYSIYEHADLLKGSNSIGWSETNKTQGVRGDFAVPIPAGSYIPTYNYANGKTTKGQIFTLKENQTNSFKLKAPTDVERGNVITTIKAGQYMNICWDKPSNFTDQLINFSLIDSQVKGGSNVTLGGAYLSHNCYVAIVPSNFSAGVTNVVATNADNSLYSNSPSFEVLGQTLSPVTSTFNYLNSGSLNSVAHTYQYTINNYRNGLVMDVEVKVDCPTYPEATYKMDCSKYIFNLGTKGGQVYNYVLADPYVKGGTSYRFTDPSHQIDITGYPVPGYTPIAPYIAPVPSSIEYKFILRDINNGGATLWSETKIYNFKG